ncbi:MAG: multidrug effflux MFS transporter [Rhizobiales bacterium]|nr:multidrug effflux MFS transporter [Hyphomicrobiales bacterium]MBL6770267.1 multidrug effflux MFS transporter [Hyphomicrobiales bacterium]
MTKRQVQKQAPIAVLFTMLFAGQIASTIFLPGLPSIAVELQIPRSIVQIMVPVYLAAFASTQLIIGPLSDKFGRKPIVLLGILLFTFASYLCANANDIQTLLLCRVAQATGACSTLVISRAIIRDTSEGLAAAKAMSYVAIAMAIGPIMAPFIGGFLTGWFSWRATFLFTTLIGFIILILISINLKETLPKEMRNPPKLGTLFSNYIDLLKNKKFTAYSLITAFASGAMQAYVVSSPIIFIVLMGVSPEVFGFYVMVMPSLFVLATFISRKLMDYISVDQIIIIGGIFSCSGGVLQLFFGISEVQTPMPVLIAFAISNFGTGLVLGNCYAAALNSVKPEIAGSASALGGFLHFGWGALITITLANIEMTSSFVFSVAQLTTTSLALATIIILNFIFNRNS